MKYAQQHRHNPIHLLLAQKMIVCQDTEENKIGLSRGISFEVSSAVLSTVENRSVPYI